MKTCCPFQRCGVRCQGSSKISGCSICPLVCSHLTHCPAWDTCSELQGDGGEEKVGPAPLQETTKNDSFCQMWMLERGSLHGSCLGRLHPSCAVG